MDHFDAYVAGRFVRTDETVTLRAPFDGRPFCTVSFCGPPEIAAASAAAARAFDETRRLPSFARSEVCRAIAAGLAREKQAFVDGMIDESGKPIGDARAEVDRAIHGFELAAEEAGRLGGDVIPFDVRPAGVGKTAFTRRVPVGPVAAIAPFNFPLNLAVHKIAPAIAAGCPVVLKPAEQTPTSTLRLARLVDQTAWPKGALSVVPADRRVADALVTDERFAVLSFTGSTRVGWDMKQRAGKKRVLLELGGNAPVIVDEQADLERALDKLIYGAFSHAGQKCISVQRIYCVGGTFDQLVPALVDKTRALAVGDPRQEGVLVGPMIDEANARRVEEWIAEAVAGGARVLCGGARRGTVVEPTILTDVPRDCRLAREEAFGPVCLVERAASFDEALTRANDSRFGLQAGVFSDSLAHVLAAFERLDFGAVVVNDSPALRIDHMPYGGVKDSGFGREGIRSTMREYTDEKLLILG